MIWNYNEANRKELDSKLLDAYKPTGNLWEDAKASFEAVSINIHPALREPSWEIYDPKEEQSVLEHLEEGEGEEEEKPEEVEEPERKPVEVLTFSKHRLDKNTMKILFHILPTSQVHTLKFSNNGLTLPEFDLLSDYLAKDQSKVQTIYFDWNPLYKEDFRNLPPVEDPRHEYAEEEESPFSKLVIPDKVKVLFLRGNGLTDKDTKTICDALAENQSLKVLDLSYNKITGESVKLLADLLETNKTIEFIGLAKNELTLEEVKPLLNKLGKIDFDSAAVADH